MIARDPSSWADLAPPYLSALEAEEFEDFCCDLIRCEVFDRHEDPKIDGPAGRYVPDGGRDILLTVRKQPLVSRSEYQRKYQLGPLSEDRIGRTAYGCKSGKGWLTDALDDILERTEPGRAVEILLEGGHFKLLINTVGRLDHPIKRDGVSRTPHAHLRAAFLERMSRIDPNAPDPGDRIEILDADAIASFLRARMPAGGPMARWEKHLDLVPLLDGLEAWRGAHVQDRMEPSFVADKAREELRGSLLDFLRDTPSGRGEQIAWLVGPPGVGKTRLVLDMLNRDPALSQRARVALLPGMALEALTARRLLARHPDVVLIVDDCPSLDVNHLAVQFRARASSHPSARLLVMTPASRDAFSGGRQALKWFLEPLDQGSTTALAKDALGSSTPLDERVQEIVRLSEGYPWFVALLAAEAIAEDRAPRNIREAVQWAVASRHERASEDELVALRLRRARCLLAASLTRRVDWAALSPEQQEDLARAVGLARWQEVIDTAQECVHRGILRRNLGWHYKYVTPHVVEREIIAWLLAPDGPDPGGKTLSRYGAAFLADFFETMAALDLPGSVVSAVARTGLAELERVSTDRGALVRSGMVGPRLRFIARHEPAAVAREIRRRLESLSVEELRSRTDERRDLVIALEELAARRDSFEDAEESLFRLALAENEIYGNNATATWSELFIPELNGAYRTLPQRRAILERRMRDPDPSARLIAIGAAQAMLTTHASRRAFEAFDGERPTATPDEARESRTSIWERLAERFSDPSPAVKERAKQVAFSHLRDAVRWGVGAEVLTLLAAHLDDYGDADRIQLRKALTEIRTYDEEWIGAAGPALATLEKLLSPASFQERLRQHVGTWRAARLRRNDEALDDALAREGLAEGTPILAQLDWLLSREAVRVHLFASALGRCDERGALLSSLREQARGGSEAWPAKVVFSRYLGGWKEAGRADAARPVLREMATATEDAESLALAVVELGADQERLGWIEDALRRGLLGAPCLSELGRRGQWLEPIGDQDFERFVETMLDGAAVDDSATVVRAAAALELLVDRAKEDRSRALALKPLLLRAMGRLAAAKLNAMADYYWELGAALMVEHGEAARVAELCTTLLSNPSGSTAHAWKALHHAAEREPAAAWRAVASALSRGDAPAGRLRLAFMFHRSPFRWPREEVLAWVDHDERRGRTAVALVPRGTTELDPLLRALVQRFGAHGSVANEIIARMHSTNGLVPSLADEDARDLALARKWLDDPDPEVRTFGKRLVASLEESHAYHAAEEDDERRRWGT